MTLFLVDERFADSCPVRAVIESTINRLSAHRLRVLR